MRYVDAECTVIPRLQTSQVSAHTHLSLLSVHNAIRTCDLHLVLGSSLFGEGRRGHELITVAMASTDQSMGEQPLFEAVQDANDEPKEMEGTKAWSCWGDQLLALPAVVSLPCLARTHVDALM
jgi:hypothetical protein